jgi:hypothetical protein
MFNSPRKLENLTKTFQILCDAVMDLNPKPLVGKVPEDLLECAHLLFMADTAVVRECANIAEQLTTAAPHELINLVVDHHQTLTDYLFIRSMILDGNQEGDPGDDDIKIF